MLPKERRIPRALLKSPEGKRRHSNTEYFSLMSWPHSGKARFAVSVSKKVSKQAITRNRTRRRVYSMIRKLLSEVEGGLHLISAKRGAEELKGDKLENELRKLLVVTRRF